MSHQHHPKKCTPIITTISQLSLKTTQKGKKPIPGLFPFLIRTIHDVSRQLLCFAAFIDGLFRQRKIASQNIRKLAVYDGQLWHGKNPIPKRSTMIKKISTTGKRRLVHRKKERCGFNFHQFCGWL